MGRDYLCRMCDRALTLEYHYGDPIFTCRHCGAGYEAKLAPKRMFRAPTFSQRELDDVIEGEKLKAMSRIWREMAEAERR